MESADISTLQYFVQSIEDSLLFITMMIIAEGWGVIRGHIKHYRWTSLLCKFCVFSLPAKHRAILWHTHELCWNIVFLSFCLDGM